MLVGLATPASAAPREEQDPPGYLAAASISFAATAIPAITAVLMYDESKHRLRPGGVPLVAAGLLYGPSAGHCYVGRCLTPGLAVRLLAAGVMGALALRDHYKPLSDGAAEVGAQLVYGLAIAGITLDAYTLRDAVKRRNVRRQRDSNDRTPRS